MKITALLCATLFSTASLLSISVNAAPASGVENYSYNAQKFQRACAGKTAGAPVSMVMGTAIFNGTCELKFVASSRTVSGLESSTVVQACAGKQRNDMATVPVNDREVKGKCVLAYHDIEPTGTSTQ